MHLFGCKFSLTTDTGDTVPDRKNFDSLLWAIVTVFQVSSSTCSRMSGEGVSPRTAAWLAFQRCPSENPEKGGGSPGRPLNSGLRQAGVGAGSGWHCIGSGS